MDKPVVNDTIDPWVLLDKAALRSEAMAKVFGALQGHCLNALYGLLAGETKASTIRTLQAGLALVDDYNRPMQELKARIGQAQPDYTRIGLSSADECEGRS